MNTRRSFLATIFGGIAVIFTNREKKKASHFLTDDMHDSVGEWQQSVLRRGANHGSSLFGFMAKLKEEDAKHQSYSWWQGNNNPHIKRIT